MFLGLLEPAPDPLVRGTDLDPDPLVIGTDLDPDPLVRGTDLDPDPLVIGTDLDPSIIKQKYCFVTSFRLFIVEKWSKK
jgi:hypothetical protein